MAPKSLPSQAHLNQRLSYEPDTGTLIWKARPIGGFKSYRAMAAWNGRFAGKVAGSLNEEGYWVIRIDHHIYRSSRVIWKMVTGKEPPAEIDHHDLDRGNNRFGNLRAPDNLSKNRANVPTRRHSRSGLKGVQINPTVTKQTYTAYISVNGRKKNLGCYDTPEEAHEAYCRASRELHGEFHNPG